MFHRRLLRCLLVSVQFIVITALILLPRLANWEDVFIRGQVYFVDGDCYARMTRARICSEHPGSIVRHHDFENYPTGTTPHTTAPLDYLIVVPAALLSPFRADALDQAGAWISPILAVFTGWFLWWWAGVMPLRSRWPMLLLYATSAIAVHAGTLGRPDHHQLSLSLIAVAIAAELRLQRALSRAWSIAAGAAWGFALWVSLYEPLLLFVSMLVFYASADRSQLIGKGRRGGWLVCLGVLALAAAVEQRFPVTSVSDHDAFRRWSRAIEELTSVPLWSSVWLEWTGLFLPLALGLTIAAAVRRQWKTPGLLLILAFVAFALCFWQARWAYFGVLFLAMILPFAFEWVRSRWLVALLVVVAWFPIVQGWDRHLWPEDEKLARRIQARVANVDGRALADLMRSGETEPFIAPWWVSPALSYWSGQPGVAGSSHQSLPGILATAQFYLTDESVEAAAIVRQRQAQWVLSGNADWVLENSAEVAGSQVLTRSLGLVLDRQPSRAPNFLRLVAQKNEGKLYKSENFR